MNTGPSCSNTEVTQSVENQSADAVDDEDEITGDRRLSQAVALRRSGELQAALRLLASLLEDAGQLQQQKQQQQHRHSLLALSTPRAMRLSAEILFECGELQSAKEFLHAEKMYYNAEVACADQLINEIDNQLAAELSPPGCPTSILRTQNGGFASNNVANFRRVRFANDEYQQKQQEQQQKQQEQKVDPRKTKCNKSDSNNSIGSITSIYNSIGLFCVIIIGLLSAWLCSSWSSWQRVVS